jgi:hypothetical protein
VGGKKDYPSEAKHDKEISNNRKWIIAAERSEAAHYS